MNRIQIQTKNSRRHFCFSAVSLCMFQLLTIAAVGQSTKATLRGQVLDSQGAAIAGAKVRITQIFTTSSIASFTFSNGNVFSTAGVTAATSHPGYVRIVDPNFLNPKIFSGGN